MEFDEASHTYKVDGQIYDSVTQWVSKQFKPFDADHVIPKMMASHRWPQSKWYGMTPDEIKAAWDANGKEAADLGTQMHAEIEAYYKGVSTSVSMAGFDAFVRDHSHLKPFQTEWRIFDRSLKIAGTVDMVFQDGDKYHLYDWKRCKEFKKYNSFQKSITFDDLPDCNVSHYRLQLSMYKLILERNYGIKITDMYLVRFHPNCQGYEKLEVKEVKNLF